ncbi:hypothetical protein AK812_SmicGene25170 [Symbiodinium microadriaticum]|uniref:Uncharacterized protein n=1 Tax=Symbiodinium microadriaticum TaxID=2951 RepID=A0A1Q9DCM6_SYMMI|nr:hypothetical protein AK812_SmicGene25170 [Symbiodinium microadriaticum]
MRRLLARHPGIFMEAVREVELPEWGMPENAVADVLLEVAYRRSPSIGGRFEASHAHEEDVFEGPLMLEHEILATVCDFPAWPQAPSNRYKSSVLFWLTLRIYIINRTAKVSEISVVGPLLVKPLGPFVDVVHARKRSLLEWGPDHLAESVLTPLTSNIHRILFFCLLVCWIPPVAG